MAQAKRENQYLLQVRTQPWPRCPLTHEKVEKTWRLSTKECHLAITQIELKEPDAHCVQKISQKYMEKMKKVPAHFRS